MKVSIVVILGILQMFETAVIFYKYQISHINKTFYRDAGYITIEYQHQSGLKGVLVLFFGLLNASIAR